jgi:hypothetical protein
MSRPAKLTVGGPASGERRGLAHARATTPCVAMPSRSRLTLHGVRAADDRAERALVAVPEAALEHERREAADGDAPVLEAGDAGTHVAHRARRQPLEPVGTDLLDGHRPVHGGHFAQHRQDRRRELPEEHLHLHDVGRVVAQLALERAPPRRFAGGQRLHAVLVPKQSASANDSPAMSCARLANTRTRDRARETVTQIARDALRPAVAVA